MEAVLGSTSSHDHDDVGDTDSNLHGTLDWWQLASIDILGDFASDGQVQVVRSDGSTDLVDPGPPPSPYMGMHAPRY